MDKPISRVKVQLRIGDIDGLNHVNNANYLTFFEIGRVDYFMNTLKVQDINDLSFVVKNAEIEYKRPIHFNDNPVVETWISKIGNTSSVFSHRIFEQESNILYAQGKIVIVYIDKKGNKIEIPSDLREKLREFVIEI
ncbi:acyl-CoA thioesterase [Cuniculiplasma sp. SKW3]|uniref:acyl-CoA thioesterase n=1 Tax=Cuniculiplasma sp. SKW3 TaxID=3400170 RepID=UPI003FCF37DF